MDSGRHIDENSKHKQKKKDITHRKVSKTDSEGSAQDYTKLILSSVGNSAISNLAGGGSLQAKLNISRPGDFYEKQADNAAEQVMKSSSDTTPPEITPLQSKNSSGLKVSKETEKGVKNLKGKGTPINRNVRDYFQPRFGADLGNVRIHTGNNANKLAESVNARAFTHGNDIVFAKGEFQPASKEGKKLIAHELAHVQQQGSGSNSISRKPEEGKGSQAVEGQQVSNEEQTQTKTPPVAVNPPKNESVSLVAIAGESVGRFINFLTGKLVDGSIGSLEAKIKELRGSSSEEAAALIATYEQRIQELVTIRGQIKDQPITVAEVDNALQVALTKVLEEKYREHLTTLPKESDQKNPEEAQKKMLDNSLDAALETLKKAWEELKPKVTEKILSPAEDYGGKIFWEYLGPGSKVALISTGVAVVAGLEVLTAHLVSKGDTKLTPIVGFARNGLEGLGEVDISVGDHVTVTPKLGGYDDKSTGVGGKVTVGNDKASGSVAGGITHNYSKVESRADSWGPWCRAELKIKNVNLFENTTLNIEANGEYREQLVEDPSKKEEEVKSMLEKHMLSGGFSIGTITRLGGAGDNRPTLGTNISYGLSRDLTQAITAHTIKANLNLDLQNKRKFGITYEGQFGDKTKNSFSAYGQIKNLRITGSYDTESKNFIATASLVWQLPF